MSDCFERVKNHLGFGCMRLPMKGDEVDYEEFNRMIDAYMEAGFNYFDTAHGYISGKSETALRDCLASRYPRESYVLTDKLSGFFDKEEDIRPLFEKQLKCSGVDYFDIYLMHAQSAGSFEKYKQCRAYEISLELLQEGRIRHFGISFHDKAEVLEQILTEYPQIEVVQLQFNYLDYEDAGVQSRRCYEVCRRFGKPVIVMEPVKGGRLANLPPEAAAIFDGLNNVSHASYAMRYAAGFDGVELVLSGMSNMAQMEDNIRTMTDVKPLDQREREAVEKVREIILMQNIVSCTACRYCVDGCPKQIAIPDLFSCLNARTLQKEWSAAYRACTEKNGKADECISCGKCEQICPQHLEIRQLLQRVAKELR